MTQPQPTQTHTVECPDCGGIIRVGADGMYEYHDCADEIGAAEYDRQRQAIKDGE